MGLTMFLLTKQGFTGYESGIYTQPNQGILR